MGTHPPASRPLSTLAGFALLALGLLVALPGCDRLRQPGQGALETVRVAYTVQPQCTLVDVAVAKGYFAAEGLRVQPLVHTFGKACLDSMLAGQADFATVAETPLMFSFLKGEQVSVIANIEASTLNNAIVGRRDAGITRAADLRGRRIAFTPGTTSEFFLDSLLTAIGVSRQQIVPVPMKPDQMQAAILAGQVDAVCTWNYPLALIKRQLGGNGCTIVDRDIYTETYNVAVPPSFGRTRPETVKRFLRALIRAERFVAGHPAEAQAIVSQATGIEPAVVSEVWNAFRYQVRLDQGLVITLEDETRWAMRNQLIAPAPMPDFRDWIDLESLRAIRPDSVKITR